jgi:tripartite-type tricarboxylate transporter receptor subunit TctC
MLPNFFMMMHSRILFLIFTLVVGMAGRVALAQSDYPVKPIRIVVAFGAGGVADLTARTVAQKMSEGLGQPVMIENKPGAGGIVAAETVVKAEPDGYTLFLMSNGTAVSAGLFKKMPFDPRRDLVPVSLLGQFDLAVLVPESSPYKSLTDLLAWGRAHPGQLNLGTIQIGSTQHLAAELFRSQANLIAQVVPYNGTPAVIHALRGGQIDAAIEILGPMKSQIQAKAVRALAVMGDTRPADLPNVPLVSSQAGLSSFNVSSWNALAAPARTPSAVIARLNLEAHKALNHPDVKKRLADLNVLAKHSSPEQLGRLLDTDIVRWSDVIQKAGIPKQ